MNVIKQEPSSLEELWIQNNLGVSLSHCDQNILVSQEHGNFDFKNESQAQIAECNGFVEHTECKIEVLEHSLLSNFQGDLSAPNFQRTFRERKYFSCAFCSYRTKFKYNLIRHVNIHGPVPSQVAQFKCTQCPFESDKNSSLQRHLKVHSGIFYKCAHCDFETKHKENLPKHLLRHKDPSECRMYDCDECEYETKDKLGLKRHMLTHRRLEEVEHFKCGLCNFMTKHQLSYNNHLLKIHNKDKIEKFQCPECDFGTYHKISLKNHILTHRKPGEVPMYKCPECPYETKNKQFLPNHMKRHQGTMPCPKCQKQICRRGMTLHLKTHESKEAKKKYQCEHCDYGTLYFGNMSRHKKIMHSNKAEIDYKLCPECPFKTFENARLKRHIKEMHCDDAPQFNCDHCDFTSKFRSCLKRHIDTAHINTDPVTCPVCQKQSANVYTLRIHMKLHKPEGEIKMFQCAECPYKTRHSGAYKDHVRKHETPTKYDCKNCPFKSDDKSLWNNHISRKTDVNIPENTISCKLCCYRTRQNDNLQLHVIRKHERDRRRKKCSHCTLCDFKSSNRKLFANHLKGHKTKYPSKLEEEAFYAFEDADSLEETSSSSKGDV
ncbi:zinc finger protein 761 [Dendroctonus ponderosae]|uniref:Protein hunchback n=1 Tax=Dendroctonus ponderosae TaxID=77166 RepID=A0AAR5PDR6_DENPD|nr:zinc finger protein 761 [Dendroctonus ponderosae]KAH1011351.1 hypothetical protein HUJ04_000742 [Dendroctonus ponderosae]KAH1018745.1 hypothetical protein HUJ05_006456 [Dendroctonus ponderosae]KAH1018746.1 hypothetical protein HUJ05_006456 [Dendroctonus ponderosae]